jgi:hypothetical protein
MQTEIEEKSKSMALVHVIKAEGIEPRSRSDGRIRKMHL